MPRIPAIDALGARPTPRFQRSIASQRNRGGIADAAGKFGANIADVAGRALASQDKIAAETAKVAVLSEAVKAKEELAQTPDYDNWLTKFDARMAKARAAASKGIGSRSARQSFDLEVQQSLLGARADLSKAVFGRKASAAVATADETLAAAQDGYRDAPDDQTRTGFVDSVSKITQGLVDSGFISAEEGRSRSSKWVSSVSLQRAQVLKDAGDLNGARRAFESTRRFMDAETEMRFEAQLQDAEEERTVITAADGIMASLTTGVAPTQTPGKGVAATPQAMVAITAQSESGNRDFRADGSFVTSPKGARGRMQVMPYTQRDPGFGVRPAANDSAEELARVGRDYLQAIMRRYGNDPAKAWAAYNGGPGRVDKALAKGGDWLARMPAETQSYVRKNLKALGGNVGVPSSAGQQYDLGSYLAAVDAQAEAENWTPERREKVKDEIERRVNRAEKVVTDSQNDAYERALAKANSMGAGFTSPHQLGQDFANASPQQQRTLITMAEANAAPKEAEANGDMVLALKVMQMEEPDRFADIDLRPYRPFMTPAEFEERYTAQIKAKESNRQWSPHGGVMAAIEMGEFGGVKLTDPAMRYRVYSYIDAKAYQFRSENKGKTPSKDDYNGWFREAATSIYAPFMRGLPNLTGIGVDIKPRGFRVMNDAYREQIVRSWKNVYGRAPTEAEIARTFERMGQVTQ